MYLFSYETVYVAIKTKQNDYVAAHNNTATQSIYRILYRIIISLFRILLFLNGTEIISNIFKTSIRNPDLT